MFYKGHLFSASPNVTSQKACDLTTKLGDRNRDQSVSKAACLMHTIFGGTTLICVEGAYESPQHADDGRELDCYNHLCNDHYLLIMMQRFLRPSFYRGRLSGACAYHRIFLFKFD